MSRPYAIAAVAKLTGLSVDTLRAWERRYGVVVPQRDAKGTRHYGQADVERLELLRSATSLGHAIRHLAKLTDDQIRALVHEAPVSRTEFAGPIVQKILQSIRRYDVSRAEELLARAALLSKPQDFVITVLSPLMTNVGRLWERRVLSIAHEHLISVLVRNLLGSLMRQRPSSRGVSMLFATLPGEPHEFGIDLAASLASMQGVRACMLGTNVPVPEIQRAARYLRPNTIVIGTTLDEQGTDQYVASLRSKTPKRTNIWLGGEAAQRVAMGVRGVERIATLPQYCDRIARELQ